VVARAILVARAEEAESETVQILESLGSLDVDDLQNRQANALKDPISHAARQSELILSLARTIADQAKRIADLEEQLAASPEKKAIPEKTKTAKARGPKK